MEISYLGHLTGLSKLIYSPLYLTSCLIESQVEGLNSRAFLKNDQNLSKISIFVTSLEFIPLQLGSPNNFYSIHLVEFN